MGDKKLNKKTTFPVWEEPSFCITPAKQKSAVVTGHKIG